MKKKNLNYGKMNLIILAIAGITTGGIATTFGRTDKDQPGKTLQEGIVDQNSTIDINPSEENDLMNQLIRDGLISQFKGFVVEKQKDKLWINGKEQTAEIAKKYLSGITKDILRIQVFSYQERQRQHPDARLMQLLLPTTFSSPCVVYNPEPGC